MPDQPSPRWITAKEVSEVDLPPGGSTGQVLAKTSNADREVDWTTVAGTGDVVGPGSATEGHLAVFADGTGKLIEDGGAPGGGGSFLSANTARVDPSGNDGTGEVGDLSKPFLTVQAALDAIADNEYESLVFGGVILLPATNLSENLTLSVPASGTTAITFRGQRGPPSYGFVPFNLLTITAAIPDTGVVEIFLEDLLIGTGGVTTDVETVFLFLNNVDFNGGTITLDCDSAATIGGFGNTSGNVGYIVQGTTPRVTLFGLWTGSSNTEVTLTDGRIDIIDCQPRPDEWQSYSGISVDDGTETGDGGTVNARNSILGDVKAGFITCVDSRIVGSVTTTADPPVDYQDVFLKGVPPGGTTGQVLDKASNDDFDTQWNDLA